MNEVRDIVARMMEEPAPPLRPAEEVLAVARQAHLRRSWATAAGSGALALALVVGVGVAVRSLPPSAPPETVAVGPLAQVPPAHGAVMAQRIVGSLPVGMVAAAVETFSDDPRPVWTAGAGQVQLLAAAVVRVRSAEHQGELFAYLVRDGHITDGEPAASCADAGTGGNRESCTIETVNGISVRLVVTTDAQRGQGIEATRYLAGGRLVVGAWQGRAATDVVWPGGDREQWWLPPLPTPLDPQVLVTLAADPAMLPG